MSKKILFVATVVKRHINAFHLPYLKMLKEQGWETHVCAKNDYENKDECIIPNCDYYYNLPFTRSPFSKENLKAYFKLKKIIDENHFDVIHCHTPVGGVLTRIAGRSSRIKGTKIIYTAHGFHFHKDSPKLMWATFYPIEKVLSRFTDCLITLNKEDYQNAVNHAFKAKKIELINGVGIDLSKFVPQTYQAKKMLRKKHGYDNNEFILIYVGELNKSKNQLYLIQIVRKLKLFITDITLLLVGSGSLEGKLSEEIKNHNLEKNIRLLGYRNDVPELMALSDIAVSASKREGLPLNILEAMATNLPLVVTACRGNRDLVKNHVNGYVVDMHDTDGFSEAILKLYKREDLRNRFRQNNRKLIINYSLDTTLKEFNSIYDYLLEENFLLEERSDESSIY